MAIHDKLFLGQFGCNLHSENRVHEHATAEDDAIQPSLRSNSLTSFHDHVAQRVVKTPRDHLGLLRSPDIADDLADQQPCINLKGALFRTAGGLRERVGIR